MAHRKTSSNTGRDTASLTPAGSADPYDGIDPFFIIDYHPIDDPDPDRDGNSRQSTYWDVQKGCRGPAPVPPWLVTDRAAVDTDLGIMKTGKEADVHLVERAVDPALARPGEATSCLMAVKFYRDTDHRTFHRSTLYTEGRRTRRSRDSRALERKSAYGRELAAHAWASAEWGALCHYYEAGLPVPYPIQVDGTEICMEFIGDQDGEPAPRLAQLRPEPALVQHLWHQTRDIVLFFAAEGAAHGDLSAYNLLVQQGRVVVIDLPQVVDIVANPSGPDLLRRDIDNVCDWFAARGVNADADELMYQAWGRR
ncbi:MAG: serine protein kinase RIO [Actinomycetales bacterium]